eukprot:TRINITY_DN24124_c0_g2_i1.p1 TRINITY_DN24124_c0_g2~~TRINITY_DN24124_c0_g2_i1.p1  ORF type:complete len:614 (-),score=139.85 TRINITY_DN24124_c0_g2_i1:32-1873(-)
MSGVSVTSCRVWLPDIVLPAGAKLKEALAGPGGANIDHLQRKHQGLKFTVKGQPSTDLAPWRRLHVVVQGTDQRRLAKAERDLVDLCETACDVAADVLGLTDDQVQDAFDSIRVERQDADARTVAAPAPMAAFSATAPVPLGLNSIFQANLIGMSFPGPLLRQPPTLQQTSKAPVPGTTPKSTPLQRIIASPVVLQPGLGILPPGMPPHMAPLPAVPPLRQSVVRAPVPTVESVPSAEAHAEVAKLAQAWVNKGARPAETLAAGQAKRRKKAKAKVTEDPYMSAGLSAPAVEDPYMVPATVDIDPYMVPVDQEVRPTTPEKQPEAPASKTVINSPGLSTSDTVPSAAAATAKAEGMRDQTLDAAQMPPPAVPAQKKKNTQTPSETAQTPGQQTGSENEGASDDDDSESGSSDSESESDSQEEGEEEEEEDDDEEIEAPVEPEFGAKADDQQDTSDDRGKRLQLYKLGARCCGVVAHFVGGNATALPLSKRLDIDQRVRLEHCRKHLQAAGDTTTVWHLGAADPNEKAAWTALCSYFVSRKRVGLADLEGGAVYIVPPDESFLSELGLPAAAGSLAGSLLGLQVPHSEAGGGESQEAEPESQKEAAPEQTGEQK